MRVDRLVLKNFRGFLDMTLEFSQNMTVFDDQLNDVLNLNFSRLKSNRRAVVRAVQKALAEDPGTRNRSQIEHLISLWDAASTNGKRKEFSAVAIYFLKKRLRRV